ncbi:hypothetical protein, partial [Loktanella atrilutea]|uniref:hypothetical protein n=1 Tax=Loktanella atrilutea TaxID=366533 RepID=UPI001C49DDA5
RNPKSAIYRRLIHRTEPNRPHISSDITISNSVEAKRNKMRQKSAPHSNLKEFSQLPDPPDLSASPPVHLCAAGEGLFTESGRGPQPSIAKNLHPARKKFGTAFCAGAVDPDQGGAT